MHTYEFVHRAFSLFEFDAHLAHVLARLKVLVCFAELFKLERLWGCQLEFVKQQLRAMSMPTRAGQ